MAAIAAATSAFSRASGTRAGGSGGASVGSSSALKAMAASRRHRPDRRLRLAHEFGAHRARPFVEDGPRGRGEGTLLLGRERRHLHAAPRKLLEGGSVAARHAESLAGQRDLAPPRLLAALAHELLVGRGEA